ncbi:nucleoside triphosphate pyrophosphohydrolase [Aliiglaciecola litoralis]|uniref:Nucleoside triphosphate pyrophosphohydrolase n=1 Tax=Aliiglaciecola litoralis TaxID=582857 RepID=A0ABP3WTR5_9ALTE
MPQSKAYPQLDRLLSVMRQLRDPETGCPWDQQQSFETIVPYTIEEAYEVADAIARGNMNDVKDELGDLLFQVVFYAQLGEEQQVFDFENIAQGIADKLIRRHPHVFENVTDMSTEQLSQSWDAIKRQEQQQKSAPQTDSILANIPLGMAPLIRAQKLQNRCAKVGFDWPQVEPVIDKVKEEVAEVMEELEKPIHDQSKIEEEIGDLLFAVVNLARHLKVDSETAIRKANAKFEQRFKQVELLLKEQGRSLESSDLDTMEAAWQQVKKLQ